MRYVRMKFACSISGCEATAEHDVHARLSKGNKIVVGSDYDLPDGWSNMYSDEVRDAIRFGHGPTPVDDEKTLCPVHSWDAKSQPSEG